MFFKCFSLKYLNLTNINTNKVIEMNYMFYDCSSLNESNLSNIDTNNITKMNWMFLRMIQIYNFFCNNKKINLVNLKKKFFKIKFYSIF